MGYFTDKLKDAGKKKLGILALGQKAIAETPETPETPPQPSQGFKPQVIQGGKGQPAPEQVPAETPEVPYDQLPRWAKKRSQVPSQEQAPPPPPPQEQPPTEEQPPEEEQGVIHAALQEDEGTPPPDQGEQPPTIAQAPEEGPTASGLSEEAQASKAAAQEALDQGPPEEALNALDEQAVAQVKQLKADAAEALRALDEQLARSGISVSGAALGRTQALTGQTALDIALTKADIATKKADVLIQWQKDRIAAYLTLYGQELDASVKKQMQDDINELNKLTIDSDNLVKFNDMIEAKWAQAQENFDSGNWPDAYEALFYQAQSSVLVAMGQGKMSAEEAAAAMNDFIGSFGNLFSSADFKTAMKGYAVGDNQANDQAQEEYNSWADKYGFATVTFSQWV